MFFFEQENPSPLSSLYSPQTFNLTDPPQRRDSRVKNSQQAQIEEQLSFDGPPDAMITVAGKTYHYFAGNGYFGLQSDPEVLAATCEAVLRYGVGTATSRAAFTSPPVFEVERRVAEMVGTESAFYTASGYIANQILLESLNGTFDRIFIDESSHYSLFDATKKIHGSRLRPITFQHGSVVDLKEKLDTNLQLHERPLVLTDGVFSFLGDMAPLDQYIELLANYDGASLFVDDAHGFGVLGATGCGTLEHFGYDISGVNRTTTDSHGDLEIDFGFEPERKLQTLPINVYLAFSLSKAVGGCGGAIPGTDLFVQRLKEQSTVFVGASAPATPIAAATAKALAILVEPLIRERLRKNTFLLKTRLRDYGLTTDESAIPILILTLGSSGNMRRLQKKLSERGFLISYLPRYAGLGSEGALRIALFATHTEKAITELADAIMTLV